MTAGALLIVLPFVSMWRTFKRIRRAGQLAGVADPLEPGIAMALTLGAVVYVVPIALLYEQNHLNELWKQAGAEEGRSDAAAPVPLPAQAGVKRGYFERISST